ncbi:nucleotidyltransferase family protein [Paenibacillus sp. FA6]|uniref:nucleotidyltransferase family protein n=1 Tax=Paenibacillus sp. FA6 TaxID=3413029 RepID=UPI003F65A0EE
MIALILAAGYATRLYPLTLNQPKSLLPIGNQTILDYMIDELEQLDEISQIYIVSNDKFYQAFVDWADSRTTNTRLHIINDGTTTVENKLGAVGDIHYVIEKEQIQDDLMVLAGDNIFTFDLRDYIQFFYKEYRDSILVQQLDKLEDLQRVGVVELDNEQRVLSFEEKPVHPKTNIGVFAIYIYRKDTLPLFDQYLSEGHNPDAPSYFPEWLHSRKEIRAYDADGDSYDIGTHEAYREVQELFASKAANEGNIGAEE